MVQDKLKASILEKLTPRLPPNVASALTQRIDSIASNVSDNVSKLASVSLNTTIDDVKKNLEGVYDPVDLVASNLSPQDLSNNIGHVVVEDIQEGSIESFYAELDAIVLETMPDNADYTIESIREDTIDAVSEFMNETVVTSVENAAMAIYNTASEITDVLGNVFDTISNINLDDITDRFTNLIGSEALSRAAKFNALNEENIDKLTKTSKGFADPTGTYPKEEYKDKPDTNKLAQGDVKGTVVQKKDQERITGAKLPNGVSWDQPKSSFKGQYPYNKVHQTESGHIVEFDDTPGAERIHIYHRSGTFIEIDPNGSITSRTKGSEYKIVDCNGYISIAGKANVSINGECNVHVGANANIEVEGDAFINSRNDIEINAAGRLQLTAKEAIDIRSPMIYVDADDEFHLTAGVKSNITTQLMNIISDTDFNISVGNNTNFKTANNLMIESANDSNFKSGGKVNMQSGGDGNMKFGGTWNADSGGNTLINQGSAGDAAGAGKTEVSKLSNAGLPGDRVANIETVIKDPVAMTLADQYSLKAETESDDYDQLRKDLITKGIATEEQLSKTPNEIGSDTSPAKSTSSIIPADESLLGMTALPDNFQLSPKFTLGMLSSKAAVTKDRLVAQRGLSYGQIAYNLQVLALNVLEPIYNAFPKMIVTSAFRDEASSSKTSQHPLGMAVDIQFRGMSKDEYFEMAKQIKDMIIFDQLLLEYCEYTNSPWIHISLDATKQRKQIMTFFNHKKYADGLSNLA